jgi:putative ABC transport system ATP-binding protein
MTIGGSRADTPSDGSESAAVIEVVRAVKRFRDGSRVVRALDDVSLTVRRGEFVAVVGASGSGKTTLLHAIAGLERLSAGEVLVEGRALSGLGDDALARLRRRRIGLVFQAFHLLPTLTVAENVGVPLILDGIAPRVARTRVAALLAPLGLGGGAERLPASLSGGEAQRVAVARAVVADPAVLLADEPTGNLDDAAAAAVLHVLRGMGTAARRTVLLVTHDRRIAAQAERVVRLAAGRVVDDRTRAVSGTTHVCADPPRE